MTTGDSVVTVLSGGLRVRSTCLRQHRLARFVSPQRLSVHKTTLLRDLPIVAAGLLVKSMSLLQEDSHAIM